ncbi:DNA primase [Rubripirellula lacrimiformis]|uniref:DNA primase n=1 Tax=Rubripirellula lacrimiformis TaxID=1930273 RepID=A0A517NBM8_9BACT|nr:DNA primase [Rubripirellula lacrimiformis]QDT04542.1 DNA primase [Rubripirellula lacrimiformis]
MSLPTDLDLKERVRSAVDIVDVIGATLELQPQGRNFVTRCPWHNDRRPSMTVNQERQSWKCWPCDIGGDVFSFVMRRDGVDFPTAVRTLAELAGIPLEQYTRGKKTEPGTPEDRDTLLRAMQLISDQYFEILDSGRSDDAKIARDYLAKRGIDDENRKRFQIGFAPDEWSFAVDLLAKHQFSGDVAQAAGIASAKKSGNGHVDMFRGRLMFPIHDLQNRPIALGGRIIPAIGDRHGDKAGPKYINGRETLLFRKSHQLYGLQLARDAIRRNGEVLVMEGYTDVVAARQAGVESAVAVLGTALGEQHVKILKRFAQRVVLVLDGDNAGQTRADQVLELFVGADVDLRVLTLPEGSDPADYLESAGRESFDRLVTDAPDALDHKLSRLTEGIDFTRDTHAVTTAVDTMLKIVAKAPPSLRVDQLLVRLSRSFELKTERLERRLDALREEARQRTRTANRAKPRPQQPSEPSSPRADARPNTRPGPSPNQQQRAVPDAHRSADPNDAFLESAEMDSEEYYGEPVGGSYSPPSNTQSRRSSSSPRLVPLAGLDRQLFETLIESPDMAAMAVEAIDPEWFESNTAKMLMSAYQDLELAGRELDVDSLLLLVENEQIKNQIVTLQERVKQREGRFPETPEQRYTMIMALYRKREVTTEKTRQIQKLASASLGEDEEVALLNRLIEEDRLRHGIKSE